ncbi:MAG: DUF357 domain-containing protein [Methanocalculus sp. MSAO_Arc1]|uniref:DUF357 domain-containing protein n=1 Tax=Methanocalculus TaxID=71151 RepID=UPI000FF7E4DE|nr:MULTISPECIES: DUF357 domain-containing protein [unclassified Methanocalculus]MCP1662307.1 hypothetical protein [Methanocalculus sp. AMF5]RQD80931.1 MAG: DUF357 domain-containing protein [Methanocalculus sp. MSAO_Arc1]
MSIALAALCASYTRALDQAVILVSDPTPCRVVADQILEMSAAYLEDGLVFYQKDDPVNALASWTYGFGWLDAGAFLGLLATDGQYGGPGRTDEFIPAPHSDHLTEKTTRYEAMLAGALQAVAPAPDRSSPLYLASCECLDIVRLRLNLARDRILGEDYAAALAHLSYGYGWLDCGVRSGIFGITGNRHLFTA